MNRILRIFIFLLLFPLTTYAVTCKDVSVQINATVQKSPARITLSWVSNANATGYTVYRKLKPQKTWGSAIANLPGTTNEYVDNTVSVGVSYEYKVICTASGFTGYGYINSGIEIPLIENRGSILLLIDNTFESSLATEITRLVNDLEGDGWGVIKEYVSRTATVPSVKDIIRTKYNFANPALKAVFLLGHVPVPYSGIIYPDGHTNHQGAWPADVYYADMTADWTDTYVNITTASDSRNWNVPGDGKFDRWEIPKSLELQVGRVDFYNMPAFSKTETQLLKDYLDKNHNYRHKIFSINQKALIDDNFGYFSGEAFAANGFKNFSPLVGSSNVIEGDYFTSMASSSYLWSFGCGAGTYTSASGIGTTTNFANGNLQNIFTVLFGSYFGDWDTQNNFLRAPLGQGKTLASVWSGRAQWVFHHMGLGETIGYSTVVTQTNDSILYFDPSQPHNQTHIALMGDPTLRNNIVTPPANLIVMVENDTANITWTPSSDNVLGYYVYRKEGASDYVRVSNNIVTEASFSEPIATLKDYTYMVRAIKLEVTPSGSYYNISQGITYSLSCNDVVPTADFSYSVNGKSLILYNTSDNSMYYEWNFGDETSSTLVHPIHTYNDYESYEVVLKAINSCYLSTTKKTITLANNPNTHYVCAGMASITFPCPETKKYRVDLYLNNILVKIVASGNFEEGRTNLYFPQKDLDTNANYEYRIMDENNNLLATGNVLLSK